VALALQERGFDVHRASRQVDPSPKSLRLDLSDVDATEEVLTALRPDVVVQMTGGAVGDPAHLARSNIVPTINLIRAAARRGEPPSIFVTGSAAEYGDPGGVLAAEDSTARPLSAYGWMKLAETVTAGELARLHSLDLTIIRPFNPVTPELPPSTPLGNFRQQVMSGQESTRTIVCGRTDIVRDFISAKFLGEAVAELVERRPGGTVNICSGLGIRLKDVFLAAAALLDVDLELSEDPTLAGLPAPDSIVGDPDRLYSLIKARSDSSPESIASALIGPAHSRGEDA
jgi:nucleoside-diphosphate-sugar epimerase